VKRGELYRKTMRVFVIVSRQVLLDSKFSTAICAPVHSAFDGLSTQVCVGIDEGLKHDCAVYCDELVSIPKAALTDFIGRLGPKKKRELNRALGIAVGVG
jgi:mRNA interferase MazF